MSTVTAEQLRDRLDRGETVTLTHRQLGYRTYSQHPDGYRVAQPEGTAGREAVELLPNVLGALRGDLNDHYRVEREFPAR
jgi:hypothetical protein